MALLTLYFFVEYGISSSSAQKLKEKGKVYNETRFLTFELTMAERMLCEV